MTPTPLDRILALGLRLTPRQLEAAATELGRNGSTAWHVAAQLLGLGCMCPACYSERERRRFARLCGSVRAFMAAAHAAERRAGTGAYATLTAGQPA